ncbi:Nucleotide-binding universal stress protein, UspA family [Pustulibacterium marinum]|uniref:Nucleotide-binding universal stress protein, UspA family n=1 Tax=Pustulibacterium marinum TaxID=1224947 RepID=A0A1I7F8K8_9FLAO|nr:universal stress protein [Pustulibacterium marinum]SFU32517.1 Nucleotide-binding universal stress protein, UspA family [Pustulibacterium marinum]
MNKIIVPVDFSEYSEYALHTAALLAKKSNAEIEVVHMLELQETLINKSEANKQLEAIYFLRLAEQKFEDFLDKEYLEGLNVTPIVRHFKVFSELAEMADGTDLIVMGSQGSSGAKEFFIGSNTEKVVRTSDVPVLVVKEPVVDLDVETVVFACDLKEESLPAYNKAQKLFNAIGAKVQLLYVNLPNDYFMSTHEIKDLTDKFLAKATEAPDFPVAYYSDYTVEEGVLNFANVINADVIAIPTHGRTGMAHFFNGSIGEDIANHSLKPVVTFKI